MSIPSREICWHLDIKGLTRSSKSFGAGTPPPWSTQHPGWSFACRGRRSLSHGLHSDPPRSKTIPHRLSQGAVDFFARHGIRVRALLTDNAAVIAPIAFVRFVEMGLKHRRTRPYSPQTNGKATLHQTALREWAYGIHWPDSEQRNLALPLDRLLLHSKDPMVVFIPAAHQPLRTGYNV